LIKIKLTQSTIKGLYHLDAYIGKHKIHNGLYAKYSAYGDDYSGDFLMRLGITGYLIRYMSIMKMKNNYSGDIRYIKAAINEI
jgi:hypothetical protein